MGKHECVIHVSNLYTRINFYIRVYKNIYAYFLSILLFIMADTKQKAAEVAKRLRLESKKAAFDEVVSEPNSYVLIPIQLYSEEGDYTLMPEDSNILQYFKDNIIEDIYTEEELKLEIKDVETKTVRQQAEASNKIPTQILWVYETLM